MFIKSGGIFLKKELLIGMVGTTLLLGACSNGSTGNSSAEKKDVTFGEILNEGKKISYVVQNDEDSEEYKPTKDSIVYSYIFTDDGKQTIYKGADETTLKDLKDKSDKEILDIAKKEEKKAFKDAKERDIASQERDVNELDQKIEHFKAEGDDTKRFEELLREDKDELEDIKNTEYKAPQERPVKIKVNTDGSGNNTADEWFFIQPNYDESGYKNSKDDLKNIYSSYSLEQAPVKIYEDNYGWLGQNSDDPKFLITKVGEKVENINLDKPDSKYVKEAE